MRKMNQHPDDPNNLLRWFPGATGISVRERVYDALNTLVKQEYAPAIAFDTLTSAYTRGSLLGGLLSMRDAHYSPRHETLWFVCAVDVRHLRRVNDEYGFEAGDAALVATATMLAQALPTAKIVRSHPTIFLALSRDEAIITAELPSEIAVVSNHGTAFSVRHTVARCKIRVSHWCAWPPLVGRLVFLASTDALASARDGAGGVTEISLVCQPDRA